MVQVCSILRLLVLPEPGLDLELIVILFEHHDAGEVFALLFTLRSRWYFLLIGGAQLVLFIP